MHARAAEIAIPRRLQQRRHVGRTRYARIAPVIHRLHDDRHRGVVGVVGRVE
jgi:hypothetical protein